MLVALCAHGALWFLLPRERAELHAVLGSPPEKEVELEIDLDLPFDEAPLMDRLDPTEFSEPNGPSKATLSQSASPLAEAVDAQPNAGDPSGAPGEAPEGGEPSSELLTAEGADPQGARAPGSSHKKLTLDQLGVGSTGATALAPNLREAARERESFYSDRMSHHLSSELLKSDQKKGLGPEGPVLTQLREATGASELPWRSSSLFSVTADAQGKVTSVQMISAEGHHEHWKKIAQETLARLQKTKLRPSGGKGMRLTVRVRSRYVLPSGADPGVNLSIAGIPLARGESSNSTTIRLLDPRIENGNVGSVGFDVSDIGAQARRLIEAHVEKYEILGAP